MKHIKNSVGNFVQNDEADVLIVKNALNDTGYRDAPIYNGIIDRETDQAIQKFQVEKGLKVDGVLYPDGETEKELRKEVLQADATKKIKKTRTRGNRLIDVMKNSEQRTKERMSEDQKRLENMLTNDDPESVSELARQKSNHLDNVLKDAGVSAVHSSPPILREFLKYIFSIEKEDEKNK